MKKTILLAAVLLLSMPVLQKLHAQSTFTADLELILRNGNSFILDPGDTLPVGFSVVNHGPDDIDTSNFVVFSMTGVPPNFFLVVQSEDGELQPISNGDTVNSLGVQFSHDTNYDHDTTFDYCFFLRVNDYPDSFVYDGNQLNDTVCFSITYKKSEPIGIFDRNYNTAALQIAPNPATDRVNIPMHSFDNREAVLRIYSFDGRLTHQQVVPAGSKDQVPIDIHSWPKGMYVVEVESDTQKRRGRFVAR